MKVYIGPYRSWIGPYQIADLLQYVGVSKDRCFEIGEKLSSIEWLSNLCQWIDSKKKRKIKIHIDKWDSWNADNTISLIILPVLKQLRETKHGSPFVDDEDVPEHLRSTSAPPLTEEQKRNHSVDDFFHNRWEWVLDEIINAHEKLADAEWEDQYESHNDPEFVKEQERIKYGLMLFGKYYRGLWD